MFKLKSSLFVLPICVICFLISVIRGYASEESITITTYYPSPYGVYNELRLYPHNCSSPNNCDANQQGLMCYDNTTTPGTPKVCEGGNWVNIGVPAGGVMPFNLTSCPSGWSELTAARGRVILGLPSGGGLGATQGTALSVANPTRTITDVPAHSHSLSTVVDGSVGGQPYRVTGGGNGSPGPSVSTDSAGSASIDVTMPYMQFLVCVKN